MHPFGALDQPLASRRIVVGPLRFMGANRLRIEDRQVRGVAGAQKPASLQAKHRSYVESKFVDRLLQAHALAGVPTATAPMSSRSIPTTCAPPFTWCARAHQHVRT